MSICGCTHDNAQHYHQIGSCMVEGCGCQEFIEDREKWQEEKERWVWESAEDERLLSEAFHQEQMEREDNEPPSGSTNLGNPGGTTFCY